MDKEIITQENENSFSDDSSLSSVQILRSEMAQEIISRKSGFLEKWSLLIFLGILLLIFGGTWFIHYPDIITSTAVLTSENNPKEVIAKQEGHLIKLFVDDKQLLKQNDVIAWIESSANHNEVEELYKETDNAISSLIENQPQKIAAIINVNFNHLGEIQPAYEQFLIAEDAFNNYISNTANVTKVKSVHTIDPQKIKFRQQLQFLKNQISLWQNKYVLRASIAGKFSVAGNIKANDYLQAGVLLGYIIPVNDKYFMETVLPQSNFGKLDTGLHVQIRLDAYPYEEWGFLNGTINYISNVPSKNGFIATIRLDNGLITNNQRKLIFRNGLRAQAIIITKDMRLLQKFYYSFIKSTSVNK